MIDLDYLYAHHAVGLCPEERCVAARERLAALVEPPPEGTRLVLFSEELALALGASRVDWGDPDQHGRYSPTLYRTETALDSREGSGT